METRARSLRRKRRRARGSFRRVKAKRRALRIRARRRGEAVNKEKNRMSKRKKFLRTIKKTRTLMETLRARCKSSWWRIRKQRVRKTTIQPTPTKEPRRRLSHQTRSWEKQDLKTLKLN